MQGTTFTYKQTLEYLYEQLPMFQREGAAAYKKDLGNIQALCDLLDHPQEKYPTVHIAGTNGKGTVAHMLAAVLQNRGYKTALYTSPHYRDFRERIKINGEFIPEEEVVNFVDTHKASIEKIKPSFFEITVAMAFDYFAKQEVDIAIIETGLGGRLDSTNILNPDLCVITNISYDHQNMLGDTLPEIALEKAGIIKEETRVVIGEYQEEVAPIFQQKAAEKNAKITFGDQSYRAELKKRTPTHSVYSLYRGDICCYPDVHINLLGSVMDKNVTTFFQALEELNDLNLFKMVREYDIRNGLPNLRELTNYIGRWEVIGSKPTIIADSAHNDSGLQIAMKDLAEIKRKSLHMVIGMVNDKDIAKLLNHLPKDATYYFCKADIPRGLDDKALKEKAAEHGLEGEAYGSVANALEAAKKATTARDLIYVGGSTFVVAEVV